MGAKRDGRGRFTSNLPKRVRFKKTYVTTEHNYQSGHQCPGDSCTYKKCPLFNNVKNLGKNVSRDWMDGRRVMELGVLLENLSSCSHCRMGPIPLYKENIVGERRRGLGGYLYIMCMNPECGEVNMVPYGKTHRRNKKTTGMPCFVVNTKLGTAMIDCLGGPDRVNNLLSTLNIPTINNKTLMVMERRAGESVEAVAKVTTKKAAEEAYHVEMSEVADAESTKALQGVELLEDLGVGVLADASPITKEILLKTNLPVTFDDSDNELADTDHKRDNTGMESCIPLGHSDPSIAQMTIPNTPTVGQTEDDTVCTPVNTTCPQPSPSRKRKRSLSKGTGKKTVNQKLDKKFACKTRRGMTCAVDTA